MTLDPLTKDSALAAAILAEQKEAFECSYPTCHDPRQTMPGTGRPTAYCSNPKHTAVNAHRARQHLLAVVAAAEAASSQPTRSSSPVVSVSPESLRGSILSRIQLLQTDLERYVTVLSQMSDPEISSAQIQAALDQTNARVAEMQQTLSGEQALRLKAEKDLQVAREQEQAEREAAEQAIVQLEEMEIATQEQLRQAEARVREMEAERDAMVAQERQQALQRIQEIQIQTDTALAQAQTEMTRAQEEARQAALAVLEARAQTATAERLVKDAQANLDRERAEVDRVRKDLQEVRERAQADLREERQRAQIDLDRERAEITRLREELAVTRQQAEHAASLAQGRIDKLSTANDDLRAQLVQQTRPAKEPPKPSSKT